MRKRTGRRIAVWAAVLALVALTGCQNPQAETEEETDGREKTERETPDREAPEEETEAALTAQELEEWEAYLNGEDNNGFLRSSYEDVRQADLNEVFYNGAGLEQQPLTEEVRRAYEAQAGEIMTDTVLLTEGQMDAFLLEKTGYGLEEFENPPDWTWLEAFDLWMKEHGDTNRMDVVCDSGARRPDGTVELFCSVPGSEENAWISAFTVTMEQGEDGFLFRKNEITEGLILDEAGEEAFRDPEAFDPGRIGEFTADADVSGIAGFETWGDFGDVTEENLYGVWYCPEDGVSPGTVLILSADGARVYSPLLDRYGDRLYAWEVTDRSASGLCPALKIYFHGTDTGPLTYYIAGLEPEYFWCNSQQTIFYRQGGSSR